MNKSNGVSFQCFTHEEVKKINKKIKENIIREEPKSGPAKHVNKTGKFFNVPCLATMEYLHPWLWKCQHLNRDFFGYDIYWQFHIEGFNYNVYGVGGEYEWHIDADNNNIPMDMKLTCLLNLSEEPYEGGEFYTIDSNEKHKFTSGMGLVFNSLIAHRITPVTKGERITLTYWAQGPSWR